MCTCCFYLWCPAVWREWAGFPCLGALMNFHLLVLRTGPEGQHSQSSRPLRPDFLLNIILLVLLVLQQSAIQHMHHHRCVVFCFLQKSDEKKSLQRFTSDHVVTLWELTVLIICAHIWIDAALKHSIIDKISRWQLIKWAGDTTVCTKWRLED